MNAARDIDLSSCGTSGAAVKAATARLAAAGIPDAAVDARHLVAHALGIERATLLMAPEQPIDSAARDRLVHIIARRVAREPVSRITGLRAFHGIELELGPETLDPRPDTETLVNAALALAGDIPVQNGERLRILDLGTGSGAIALALLATLPAAEATATDISASALAVAAQNAARNDLSPRIQFIQSSWLEAVAGTYHLIVSNPPYIRSGDIPGLEPEVAQWEPRTALDGGPDGLDAYRTILASVERVMAPGGWLILEVGHDQAAKVAELASAYGLPPAPLDLPDLRDLGGHTRCVAVATPALR